MLRTRKRQNIIQREKSTEIETEKAQNCHLKCLKADTSEITPRALYAADLIATLDFEKLEDVLYCAHKLFSRFSQRAEKTLNV